MPSRSSSRDKPRRSSSSSATGRGKTKGKNGKTKGGMKSSASSPSLSSPSTQYSSPQSTVKSSASSRISRFSKSKDESTADLTPSTLASGSSKPASYGLSKCRSVSESSIALDSLRASKSDSSRKSLKAQGLLRRNSSSYKSNSNHNAVFPSASCGTRHSTGGSGGDSHTVVSDVTWLDSVSPPMSSSRKRHIMSPSYGSNSKAASSARRLEVAQRMQHHQAMMLSESDLSYQVPLASSSAHEVSGGSREQWRKAPRNASLLSDVSDLTGSIGVPSSQSTLSRSVSLSEIEESTRYYTETSILSSSSRNSRTYYQQQQQQHQNYQYHQHPQHYSTPPERRKKSTSLQHHPYQNRSDDTESSVVSEITWLEPESSFRFQSTTPSNTFLSPKQPKRPSSFNSEQLLTSPESENDLSYRLPLGQSVSGGLGSGSGSGGAAAAAAAVNGLSSHQKPQSERSSRSLSDSNSSEMSDLTWLESERSLMKTVSSGHTVPSIRETSITEEDGEEDNDDEDDDDSIDLTFLMHEEDDSDETSTSDTLESGDTMESGSTMESIDEVPMAPASASSLSSSSSHRKKKKKKSKKKKKKSKTKAEDENIINPTVSSSSSTSTGSNSNGNSTNSSSSGNKKESKRYKKSKKDKKSKKSETESGKKKKKSRRDRQPRASGADALPSIPQRKASNMGTRRPPTFQSSQDDAIEALRLSMVSPKGKQKKRRMRSRRFRGLDSSTHSLQSQATLDSSSHQTVMSALEIPTTKLSCPKPSAESHAPARSALQLPEVKRPPTKRKSVTFADGERSRPLVPPSTSLNRDWSERSLDQKPNISKATASRLSPNSLASHVRAARRRFVSPPRSSISSTSSDGGHVPPEDGVDFLLDRLASCLVDSKSDDEAEATPAETMEDDEDEGKPRRIRSLSPGRVARSRSKSPPSIQSMLVGSSDHDRTPRMRGKGRVGKPPSPSLFMTPTQRIVGKKAVQSRKSDSRGRRGAVNDSLRSIFLSDSEHSRPPSSSSSSGYSSSHASDSDDEIDFES